jgi:hypothetical protein
LKQKHVANQTRKTENQCKYGKKGNREVQDKQQTASSNAIHKYEFRYNLSYQNSCPILLGELQRILTTYRKHLRMPVHLCPVFEGTSNRRVNVDSYKELFAQTAYLLVRHLFIPTPADPQAFPSHILTFAFFLHSINSVYLTSALGDTADV